MTGQNHLDPRPTSVIPEDDWGRMAVYVLRELERLGGDISSDRSKTDERHEAVMAALADLRSENNVRKSEQRQMTALVAFVVSALVSIVIALL